MNAYTLGYAAYNMKEKYLNVSDLLSISETIRNPFWTDTDQYNDWETGFADAFVDLYLKEEATWYSNDS